MKHVLNQGKLMKCIHVVELRGQQQIAKLLQQTAKCLVLHLTATLFSSHRTHPTFQKHFYLLNTCKASKAQWLEVEMWMACPNCYPGLAICNYLINWILPSKLVLLKTVDLQWKKKWTVTLKLASGLPPQWMAGWAYILFRHLPSVPIWQVLQHSLRWILGQDLKSSHKCQLYIRVLYPVDL